jgi:gluconate 2-dehydrogenase gamma chain
MDDTRHLSRRSVLEAGIELSFLPMLAACKPAADLLRRSEAAGEDGVFVQPAVGGNRFTDEQRLVLDAVQMRLFPEDGNGPSARDLNALSYLEWAMTDPVNIGDGDPDFICKGIGWLEDVSRTAHTIGFAELRHELQDEVLERRAQSKFGKNWLSLLMYYLMEALMLDPFYGGNPDMVGWMWLEHRPGFPRPVEGKTYRDFE